MNIRKKRFVGLIPILAGILMAIRTVMTELANRPTNYGVLVGALILIVIGPILWLMSLFRLRKANNNS